MIAGVMLVKDEADVIEDVVRHTAGQVDVLIVADNSSTDGTYEILKQMEVTGEVYRLIEDPEVDYYQSRKMSKLAALAYELGAEWVVPVDADEIWAAREGRLADALSALPEAASLSQAVLFEHVPTDADGWVGKVKVEGSPIRTMAYRKGLPLPLRKVAARCSPDLVLQPGNHSATYQKLPLAQLDQLVVRHFPYRSEDQFISMAVNGAEAYAETVGLPEGTGAHKRRFAAVFNDEGFDGLRQLFRDEFYVSEPATRSDLVLDPLV